MITAGPTVEAIDPVRFISNHSSGKMGYALAEAAAEAGAKVTLVSGPVSVVASALISVISVKSAQDMLDAVKANVEQCDIFVGCAAVADYAPVSVAEQKIKKNNDTMQILLKKNPDILAWVASLSNRPYVVGFAAESQNVKEYANKKLVNKKLDMICANDISNTDIGFNSDNNALMILTKKDEEIKLASAPKKDIAISILLEVNKRIS